MQSFYLLAVQSSMPNEGHCEGSTMSTTALVAADDCAVKLVDSKAASGEGIVDKFSASIFIFCLIRNCVGKWRFC